MATVHAGTARSKECEYLEKRPTIFPFNVRKERTIHDQFIKIAKRVVEADTVTESDRLSRKYGIKGLPRLFLLGSIRFPASFPFDFMHLIFENLVPNLIRHYTGDFKGLDAGTESYELPKSVWEAITNTAARSGDTIPSEFGA